MSPRRDAASQQLAKLVEKLGASKAAQRLGVTSATLARWRSRGVPATRKTDLASVHARVFAPAIGVRKLAGYVEHVGAARAARAFGVTPSTIERWKKAGVPKRQVTALDEAIARAARQRDRYFHDYVKRVGPKRAAERFDVAPTTIKRWLDAGVPDQRAADIKRKALRTLQASQEFFQKFVRRHGRDKAAELLDVSRARIDRWMRSNIPPTLVGDVRERVRLALAAEKVGTEDQFRAGAEAAAEKAAEPPTVPLPTEKPPELPELPEGFLPPSIERAPTAAPPPTPTEDEWDRTIRAFLEARVEAYANAQIVRPSTRVRSVTEQFRGGSSHFLVQGVLIEKFVKELGREGLEKLAADLAKKARALAKRKPGGLLQLKFTASGNVAQGNPFYAPIASLVIGPSSDYRSFATSTPITSAPNMDRLEARIREILIGPISEAVASNSLLELIPYMPLAFLEHVEIVYQLPGDGWQPRDKHLR